MISLWYPKWACGDCPDMLVIESKNDKLDRYIGNHVYLYIQGNFWDKKYNFDKRYGDNEYKLICVGSFKKSIGMKIYEADSILEAFNAQGDFFDAKDCTPIKTTELDRKIIQSFLDTEVR
jgi:rRNA maturation protein Rpf1